MVVKLRDSATPAAWRSVKSIKLRGSDSSWKNVVKAFIRDSAGAWRKIFVSALTPKIDTDVEITTTQNNTTKLYTLVGTNYPWQDSTGLQYQFQYSIDGVAFYDLTSLADTINPTVSNTETKLLQSSMVSPNLTNYFLFAVTGTNATYSTTSTSTATLSIEGVRDVEVSKDVEDYTSISFTWTGGLYSNGYIYQYQTYINDIGGGWSSSVYTTNPYVTITDLTSNVKYQIRVKGVTGSSTANPGYSGNWAYQVGTTVSAPAPTVTYYPSLSGTGVALTTLTPTSGAYTNYTSKQTTIIGIYSDAVTLTQGELTMPAIFSQKTSWATTSPSAYPVTQTDVTTPAYTFYTVDKVLGIDGQTLFYYYSEAGINSSLGLVTDNYGRSVSSGTILGTMSSGFVYSGYNSGSAWSVANGNAIASDAVSASSSSTGWPKQTIETSGNSNVNASVRFPGSDGGIGIAFWVTSAGSWWAATSYKASVTLPGITCTGITYTGTTCPDLGTNAGDYCDCITITIPASDPACTVSLTNQSDTGTLGTAAGQRCSAYTTNTTHSYTCTNYLSDETDRGTEATGYPRTYSSADVGKRCSNSTSTTTYSCSGSLSGVSSAGSLATLPYIDSDVGSRCSAYTTDTSYTCTGSVTGASSVGSLATTPYISSDVGVRCSSYTTNAGYTTYACDGSVSGASSVGSLATSYSSSTVGQRCSAYTTNAAYNTYECTGSVSGASSVGSLVSASQQTLGQRCSTYTTNNAYTTYECNTNVSGRATVGTRVFAPYSSGNVGVRCSDYTGSAGNYSYTVVGSVSHPATYNYSVVATVTHPATYDYSIVTSTAHPTTYDYYKVESSTTYSYNTVVSETSYAYYTVEDISSTTYSYSVNDSGTEASTGKQWGTQVSGDTPHYNTYLKIYSANGSSITEEDSVLVDSSTTAYTTVWGISLATSGDTVYSALYSDTGLTSILGNSFQKTYTSPTKNEIDGFTAAGIIKGYSPSSQGSRFDDFRLSS
jgi:hypothetical protein